MSTDTADKAKQAASEVAEQSRDVAAHASASATDVAETATQGLHDVTQAASQQSAQVLHDVTTHVRSLLGDTGSQLQQHGSEQAQKAAEGLRQFSEGARALAEGRPQDAGIAGQYVEQAGAKLNSFAERLDTGGLDGIMSDVSRFARRRPGAFLVTASAAGFVAGRLLRGAQVANEQDSENSVISPAPSHRTVNELDLTTDHGTEARGFGGSSAAF